MKVVFVASMLWEYGLGYALMPFAYLVLGKAIQEKFAPMDWNLFVKSETHKAKFRTSWTRVVTHSEAISALGGGQTERELLNRRFEGFTSMTATINRALVPFDACQRFMYMHGMGVIFFAFCVGPATFRPPSQATGAERIAENTELYGRVGYQFKMFEMLMITAWSMVNIWEQYKKLTGNGVRFNELLDTLDEIDAMDSANTNDRIVDGKIIEFKNVNVSVAALLSAPRSKQDAAAQIFTPTETKLVHDISFQVGERDSMLLTGHNGAGKSSVRHRPHFAPCRRFSSLRSAMLVQVFRCLAGLWSIDTGSITKPGGGKALAGKVFYLPQKPYQVLGTLFDQISYPAAHDPAHLTEEMAGEILDEVELGEHDTAWKRLFSLGGVFTPVASCVRIPG